jgi:co-chaperonin GroES (HSP10)
MPFMLMDHEVDPKKKLADEVGDISAVELFQNQILVAVYIRPQKTKSGLYLSDKTTDEDRYQSKVGLLLKAGPRAFEPDGSGWFENERFETGDWLVFRPSDGWAITVNGVLCRILQDVQVRGRVDAPDRVW